MVIGSDLTTVNARNGARLIIDMQTKIAVAHTTEGYNISNMCP